MKLHFGVIFFLFLSVSMLSALDSLANELPGKALLWDYNSLCEFKDSKNNPEEITYMKGEYTNTGCQELESKYGKPAAVIISLKNDKTTPLEIEIPTLSKVSIIKKNGTIHHAIALRKIDSVPGIGLIYGFLTTMTNSLKYQVSSGKKLDIIFIFDSAAKGDTIKIGDYSPLTIGQ